MASCILQLKNQKSASSALALAWWLTTLTMGCSGSKDSVAEPSLSSPMGAGVINHGEVVLTRGRDQSISAKKDRTVSVNSESSSLMENSMMAWLRDVLPAQSAKSVKGERYSAECGTSAGRPCAN